MFDRILALLAPGWREIVEFAASLVAWIPGWQARMLTPLFGGLGGTTATIAGWVLLLLPVLLLIAGMWITMVSIYTLPFRSGRAAYVNTLALTWWDAGRAVALFWAGLVRLALVLAGHLWGLLRYAVVLAGRTVREVVATPAAALDWTARRYFKPGVPWVAFLLIVAWSALEGAVFTFTLRPTMVEVLHDLTGRAPDLRFVTPILFMLLFLLIAGSFACIQVLAEAVERRQAKAIVQMLTIEFFVMFFEVMFLYRELIDAITPWIAQQTGGQFQMGLWSTLALASFGWVGIRGMTWFLFGRFGTPALLAVLSRQTLTLESETPMPAPVRPVSSWAEMLREFKAERAWFRQQTDHLTELMILPVLHLLAAALNFAVVLVSSRPAFSLPFASLDEAMARMAVMPDARVAGSPKRSAQVALPGVAREV